MQEWGLYSPAYTGSICLYLCMHVCVHLFTFPLKIFLQYLLATMLGE